MFCTSNKGTPVFVPQDEKGICDKTKAVEFVTDSTRGLKVNINSHPTCLYPNEYLIMGDVSDTIEISSLVPSGLEDRIDIYEGEFTLVGTGKVKFPSTIKWDWESKNPEYLDTIYQFRIVNGLGHMSAFGSIPVA